MDFSINLSVIFRNFVVARHRIKVTISIEVEFNDEEVAKIRQLVKDSTGDKGAGLMAILKNDASELHERISKAIFQKIFVFYLFYGLRYDGFMLDEADRRRNFKKDLESGVFNVLRRSPYRRKRVVQPLGRVGTRPVRFPRC